MKPLGELTHDERVLALLSDGRPHTHHELYALHVIAHSRVASLRSKGYEIEVSRDGDVYLYRLLGSPLREPSAARCAPGLDGSLSGGPDLPGNDMPPATEGSEGVGRVAAQLTVYDALGTAA